MIFNQVGLGGSGGGGGGIAKLTLYTNTSSSDLWVDSSATTTLLESVDYSYQDAYAMLHDADMVIVEWTSNKSSSKRFGIVAAAYYDTIDETFSVSVINVSSSSTLLTITCS